MQKNTSHKMARNFRAFVLSELDARGQSLRWLAREAGYANHSVLSRSLAEDANPTLETIQRVAGALGFEADVLFRRSIQPAEKK